MNGYDKNGIGFPSARDSDVLLLLSVEDIAVMVNVDIGRTE